MPGRFWISGFALALLALVQAGCGPSYGSPVKVKGKVTINGAPAKNVIIMFQAKKLPADKRVVQDEVGPDGTYELDNVYPADYNVILQSAMPADPMMNAAMPVSNIPLNEDGTAIIKSAKVPTGNNEFNFEF